MIKWTTPNLKCTISSDITFNSIIFTLEQRGNKIEREITPSEVEDGVFYVELTQEETSSLANGSAEVQLNVMNGDTRMATNIITLNISKNLHDEYIEVSI